MVFLVCAPLHAQDHAHIPFIIYTLLMIVIILTRIWHPKVKQKESTKVMNSRRKIKPKEINVKMKLKSKISERKRLSQLVQVGSPSVIAEGSMRLPRSASSNKLQNL